MPLKDAAKHLRIGFAEDSIWSSACGHLQSGADRAAIHQHRWLVRRADAIWMRSDEPFARFYPVGRPAEAREDQRSIKTDQHRIRLIIGVVLSQNEAGFSHFLL